MEAEERNAQDEWNEIWLEYERINRGKMQARWKKFGFDSMDRETSILDIGAGCGEFLHMLREHGFKNLKGIEPERSLIDKDPYGLVEAGNCLDLGHVAEKYDVALLFGVLHHLRDFEEMKVAAANIRDVLKEGGRFFSVEPWKHAIRTIVTKLMLETPLRRVHPYFTIESRIWKIEKPLLSQWLELEQRFIGHVRGIGFRVVLDKRDLRAHYLIYEKL